MPEQSRRPIDFWLFFSVLILIIIGLLMVFSASAPTALAEQGNSYYYLQSQLKFAIIGFAAMFAFSIIDYRIYKGKVATIFLIVTAVLLIAVLVPGIGMREGGARRWISLGFMTFQPSEMAKFALILYLADRLSRPGSLLKLKYFLKGFFIPYMVPLGFFAVLLLAEPHLSGTIIIGTVCVILLFLGGARVSHFALVGTFAIPAVLFVIFKTDYMKSRLLSFTNPYLYASGEGYQAVQSLYAIGTGGLFGKGFGMSMQKFLYLPEPQNDYIFAILAEELGLIGVLVVIALFAIVIWRGLKISLRSKDMFGGLLSAGIIALIGIQAFFNIAVVTSSVPATGVSLPFFSAGGTSLVMFMSAIGILLNISKSSDYDNSLLSRRK
jgi:cell division protein FtsW